MRSRFVLVFLAAVTAGGLASCAEEGTSLPPPGPLEISADAIGYYCNMIVTEHRGPKGQVFLTSAPEPFWFTSVRDTLAFTLLPEEPRNIAAVYVNDMARADWDNPEPGTWVEARSAWYVLDSGRTGGMGAPELVPFGTEASAHGFAREHGGRVVRYEDIPRDAVLGAVNAGYQPMPPEETGGDERAHLAHGQHAPAAHDSAAHSGHGMSHDAAAKQ